jgi:hypothetical protein
VLRDVVDSFYHGVLYFKNVVLQVKHVVFFTIVRKVRLSTYILLRKSHTAYNTVCTYVIHAYIYSNRTDMWQGRVENNSRKYVNAELQYGSL